MSKTHEAIRVSKQQLDEWNEILEADGLGDPDEPWRDHVEIEHTTGVKLPAQAVRGGGYFDDKASEIIEAKQDRKKEQPHQFVCTTCGKNFEARKGTRFCSARCRVRAFRSTSCNANLPRIDGK